jgi:hypothetical protein
MSDDLGDFFALPAFKPDEALVKLRRDLRERKPLQEQGSGSPVVRFGLKGITVVELSVADGAIQCAVAKRVSQRPEWQCSALKSSAEVRKALDTITAQLKRWEDED